MKIISQLKVFYAGNRDLDAYSSTMTDGKISVEDVALVITTLRNSSCFNYYETIYMIEQRYYFVIKVLWFILPLISWVFIYK